MPYDGWVNDGDQGVGGVAESGGCALRDVRAERLLSIRELARLAGVAPSTIFLVEAGRSTPHLSIIRRLSEALGVDPQSIREFRRASRAHAEPR